MAVFTDTGQLKAERTHVRGSSKAEMVRGADPQKAIGWAGGFSTSFWTGHPKPSLKVLRSP